MSVTQTRREIEDAQQFFRQQLALYRTQLAETHNQIQNTLTMHSSAIISQHQQHSAALAALNEEVARLKDENSLLRNQCMLLSIREDELQKSRTRILQQNAEKEQRVKELAQEVETIRNSVGSLEERREGVVDFDEGEECAKF